MRASVGIVGLGVALCGLSGGAAMACESQTGSLVFEDRFADERGGWEVQSNYAIKPPALIATLTSEHDNVDVQNVTFSAAEGEFCTQFVFGERNKGETLQAGVEFLALGSGSYYEAVIKSDGTVTVDRYLNDEFATIFEAKSPAVNTQPGAVNMVNVAVRDGTVTVSVNGTAVKDFRAQVPEGTVRFGMRAEVYDPSDAAVTVTFTTYRVTK